MIEVLRAAKVGVNPASAVSERDELADLPPAG